MDSKKNVLMICSWLDLDENIGSFFWEQAGFTMDQYNIILCVFRKNSIGPRKFIAFLKKNKIVKKTAPNQISTFYIYYAYIRFLPEKANVFLYKYYIKKFYSYLRKSGVEISLIHAQSLFNAGFEAFHLNEVSKIPFVFTEHNQLTLRNKSNYEVSQLVRIVDKANKKFVVSYDKIRQFAANGIYSDFEVVSNGVDSKMFFFDKDKVSCDNNVFKIITIGAFDPIKDQETILKAFDFIDKKIKIKIKFTWIGYDSWGHKSTNTVLKLINNFEYKNIEINVIPKLTRIEIADELRKSDLFVFSSISEGLSLSVLEALACGLPVFSTRCGGVDEIINDLNGKIVQIKDFQSMGNFICKILNKEIVFDRKMISETILSNYGDKVFGQRMKERYDEVILKMKPER